MKKIIKTVVLVASIFILNSSIAAGFSNVTLTVVNNWSKDIRVSEGSFYRREITLTPGHRIDWTSGSIYNPYIEEKKNGYWSRIPGCPNNIIYEYSMVIYVAQAAWDPNAPMCYEIR